MKTNVWFVISFFVCALFQTAGAQLQFDPRVRWQTVESPHCVIHYPQGEDSLAQAVARKAEKYLQRLTEIFRAAPKDKIHVVVDTSFDLVFGAATPIPNAVMYINPTATALGLGHYDDWLDLLVSHELTHVVDLDKLSGLPEILRSVFGRLYFPGGFGPQWLTEGLATYFETELTAGGRGRDPYHDMIVRMAFLENRVTTPDQNNAFLTRWPESNSSYVYGQSFYRYLAQQYGREALIKMRERYASNWIPFRINEAIDAGTGHGLKKAYADWKADMQRRYAKQADTLRAIGLTESRTLTQRGYEQWSPEWSADSKAIYFISSDANHHAEIRALDPATGRQRRIKNINFFETQMSYVAGPQHERLFFSSIELNHSYSLRHDIWMLDLPGGKRHRLTNGQRARHPAIDPAAEKVAYLTSAAGQTDLWIYNLRNRTTRRLLSGGPDRLFFNPAWSPDGKRLALSIWQRGGYYDIWIFDVETQRLQPLLQDQALEVSPCWSHDGRYVMFSSDRTGVFNLFAYDLEAHQLLQITNVLGGAFDPAIAPGDSQIAFVGYSSRGFDLHVMPWRKEKPVRAQKVILGLEPASSPDFVYGYADTLQPASPPTPIAVKFSTPKHYHSWRTALPRFYIPLPTIDEKGQAISVFTYGQDVLGKNSYLLSLQFGASGRPGYALNYTNNSFHPLLNVSLSDFAVPRSQSVVNEKFEFVTYWDRRREQAIQIVVPFAKIDRSHLLGLGLRAQHFKRATKLAAGEDNPYFEGRLRSWQAQYVFNNAKRYPGAIGPVEGMTFALRYEQFARQLKSDLFFYQALAQLDKFIRVPGLPRHVVQLSALAGRNDLKTVREIENLPESRIRGLHTFSWTNELYQGTLEYQFPLAEIERSMPILPIFMKRLHASLFGDAAQYQNLRHQTRRRESVGVELRLDAALGYLLESRMRLGAALPLCPQEGLSIFFTIDASP